MCLHCSDSLFLHVECRWHGSLPLSCCLNVTVATVHGIDLLCGLTVVPAGPDSQLYRPGLGNLSLNSANRSSSLFLHFLELFLKLFGRTVPERRQVPAVPSEMSSGSFCRLEVWLEVLSSWASWWSQPGLCQRVLHWAASQSVLCWAVTLPLSWACWSSALGMGRPFERRCTGGRTTIAACSLLYRWASGRTQVVPSSRYVLALST